MQDPGWLTRASRTGPWTATMVVVDVKLTLDEWVDSGMIALYGFGCTDLITSSMLDGGLSSIGSFVCSQLESLQKINILFLQLLKIRTLTVRGRHVQIKSWVTSPVPSPVPILVLNFESRLDSRPWENQDQTQDLFWKKKFGGLDSSLDLESRLI